MTRDKESATKLAVDLFTNYVGSIRWFVLTIYLVVQEVFKQQASLQCAMDHVNGVKTYLKLNPKASQLLLKRQLDTSVTHDRVHSLKYEITTRWNSIIGAMKTYFTHLYNIIEVCTRFRILPSAFHPLSEVKQNTVDEYIMVLGEVCRVARELEGERKVTMSRAPRLPRELHETLLIMAEEMVKLLPAREGKVQ